MALGDHTIQMDVTGFEDLIVSFRDLAKQYPDTADDMLRADGRYLRKEITKKAKELTDVNKSNKESLGKIGSYSVSKVKGGGNNRYVEISAKSRHFHLVEHGHQLVSHSGAALGYVPGRHFLEKAAKEYSEEMPKNVERMMEGLLKKEGFL